MIRKTLKPNLRCARNLFRRRAEAETEKNSKRANDQERTMGTVQNEVAKCEEGQVNDAGESGVRGLKD